MTRGRCSRHWNENMVAEDADKVNRRGRNIEQGTKKRKGKKALREIR